MTILVTGGTGQTGGRVARLLRDANYPVLLAARSKIPEPFTGVYFNWLEPSSYENPFKADPNIDRVYLIGPHILDMLDVVKEFVELAISKGVKRFVLVSGSCTPKGVPPLGVVHEYLANRGVDYAVLRPSWFFQNFAVAYYKTIREDNMIVSAAKDGKIPFVSVDDIADVAFRALVDEKSHNTDHIIVGPELFTYDEAAALLSDVIGRNIIHKRLTDDEAVQFWKGFGLPDDYAKTMLWMDQDIALGKEVGYFNAEEKEMGYRRLVDYFKANRDVWIPN